MIVVSEEVREALDARRPVVALESTIIAHGLPRPRNLQVALELEDVVRREGAVPATIAVLDGRPHVGLDKEQLERVANEDGIRKLGHRDLPLAVAAGASGATTVSATALLAARGRPRVRDGRPRRGAPGMDGDAGRVGGPGPAGADPDHGGVRGRQVDPGRAGDAAAPGDTGRRGGRVRYRPLPGLLSVRLGTSRGLDAGLPGQVADVMRAQDALGGPESALIVANPVPEEEQLDPALHARVLTEALRACEAEGVSGQAVTPFLLDHLVRHTDGASLSANLAAVRGNVRLAGRIAAAWAGA